MGLRALECVFRFLRTLNQHSEKQTDNKKRS